MLPLGILNYRTIVDYGSNPVTSGLILELYSENDLITSGYNVTSWGDQSGNGNDLTWNTGYPRYTSNYYGTEGAIIFTGSAFLTGTVSGLSGSQGYSLFVVSSHSQPSTGINFVFLTPGFQIYLQRPGASTQLSGLVSGDVGFLVRQIDTVDNTPNVYAMVVDFSTNPDIGTFYINGSSASSVSSNTVNNTSTFVDGVLSIGHSAITSIEYGSIIMYNRILSELELSQVNDYLTLRYSI